MERDPFLLQAIKELGLYLGRRFDGATTVLTQLKNTITSSSQSQISEMQRLGKKFDSFKFPEKITAENINFEVRALETLMKDANKHLQKLSQRKETQPEKVLPVLKELNKSVSAVVQHLPDNFDDRPILKAIGDLQDTVKNKEFDFSNLSERLQSIENLLAKKVEFKLNDTQLKMIVANKGGVYGGPLPARGSRITRVSMTSADTEYSHTFSNQCVKWRMKLADTGYSFFYSWDTGTLPQSGDASSYVSIPAGWIDAQDGEYGGQTIYFESPQASMTMEIEEGHA